jgi:hypothetical protein
VGDRDGEKFVSPTEQADRIRGPLGREVAWGSLPSSHSPFGRKLGGMYAAAKLTASKILTPKELPG